MFRRPNRLMLTLAVAGLASAAAAQTAAPVPLAVSTVVVNPEDLLDTNKTVVVPTAYVTLITDGCLECGSCRVICTEHTNVAWEYPRGGHGILFKFG